MSDEANAGAGSPPGTPPASGNDAGTPPAASDGSAQGGTPPAGNGSAAGQPKTFTQEEVNRIAAQARDEGRRAGQQKAALTTEQKPGDSKAAAPNIDEIVKQSVQQALQAAGVDPFTQAAKAAGYSDAQISIARAAHAAAQPPDTAKWLTEWPSQVGMQINQPSGTNGNGAGHRVTGADPRRVNTLEQENGLVDVFSLSEEQVKAMPIEQLVAHFEKAKAAAKTQTGAPPLPRALQQLKR